MSDGSVWICHAHSSRVSVNPQALSPTEVDLKRIEIKNLPSLFSAGAPRHRGHFFQHTDWRWPWLSGISHAWRLSLLYLTLPDLSSFSTSAFHLYLVFPYLFLTCVRSTYQRCFSPRPKAMVHETARRRSRMNHILPHHLHHLDSRSHTMQDSKRLWKGEKRI